MIITESSFEHALEIDQSDGKMKRSCEISGLHGFKCPHEDRYDFYNFYKTQLVTATAETS